MKSKIHEIPEILANPWLNNEKSQLIRGKIAKIAFTFRKNKPNLKNIKIGINSFKIGTYEIFSAWQSKKTNPNKPNSNPIAERLKMNLNIYYKKVYNNETFILAPKTNPIQTQNKFILECRSRGANKNTLKIYPFGIDCPIVFEEKLFWFVG